MPLVHLHGCHFHFCQAIYNKIVELGLRPLYRDPDNPNFRFLLRMIFSLAFLPVDQVQQGYADLVAYAVQENLVDVHDAAIIAFRNYFLNNWMNDVASWNVHDLDDRRTNNRIEGWHSHLKTVLGRRRSLRRFIATLQDQQMEAMRNVDASQTRNLGYRSQYQLAKEAAIVVKKDRLEANQLTRLNFLRELAALQVVFGDFENVLDHNAGGDGDIGEEEDEWEDVVEGEAKEADE